LVDGSARQEMEGGTRFAISSGDVPLGAGRLCVLGIAMRPSLKSRRKHEHRQHHSQEA
jgi:hypothetical protein